MFNTHTKSGIAKFKLMEYAAQQGWRVYVPLIEGGRSDLILEIDNELWRVQLKFSSQRRNNDTLSVKTATVQPRKLKHQRTKYQLGDFDLFVVYSTLTDKLYVFMSLRSTKSSKAAR